MSSLDIKCQKCESSYSLLTTELNIIAVFECSVCGRHNAYAAGQVVLLQDDVMNEGTEAQRQQHVFEGVRRTASELAENVLGSIDTIITLRPQRYSENQGSGYEISVERVSERGIEAVEPLLTPSVEFTDAPEISSEELHDFINIDLNLIDKKRHFERVFGVGK